MHETLLAKGAETMFDACEPAEPPRVAAAHTISHKTAKLFVAPRKGPCYSVNKTASKIFIWEIWKGCQIEKYIWVRRPTKMIDITISLFYKKVVKDYYSYHQADEKLGQEKMFKMYKEKRDQIQTSNIFTLRLFS